MFIYPIFNHNWRNISTIYICNKTSIKRNILTIKQNRLGSRSGWGLISNLVPTCQIFSCVQLLSAHQTWRFHVPEHVTALAVNFPWRRLYLYLFSLCSILCLTWPYCSVGRTALREADASNSRRSRSAAGGQMSSGRISYRHHHLGQRQVTASQLLCCPRQQSSECSILVDCVWNLMAHAQKPDFVFRRNGRVHLNQQGRKFSRLLAAEVWTSAVVMLDTPCS